MPLDPSIPLSVKSPQVNPLEMMGQMANTANAMNQNKLFRATMAAKQAVSGAYQSSTDPTTGQVDYGKLGGMISQNGGILTPEAMQAAQANQSQSLANQQQEMQLALSRVSALRQNLGGLLASTKPLGPSDLANAAGDLVKDKVIDAKTAATQLAAYPTDDAGIRQQIQQHLMGLIPAEQQLMTALGPLQQVGQGDKTSIVAVNPITKQPTTVGSYGIHMSPGEAASPVQTFDTKSNAPHLVTKGQFASAPGGMQAGPALGAEAGASAAAAANAQQATALTQRAAQAPTNKALLQNMEGALTDFSAGPVADKVKWLGQLASQFGLKAGSVSNATAAQEEFAKLGIQVAQQQVNALGGAGTDAKLASAVHTSPSEFMSTYGNKRIIHILEGNEDAISAQHDAWQKYQAAGHGPEDYGKFISQWNKVYDPRVFQAQYMSHDEMAAMAKGMSAEERKRMREARQFAVRAGWIGQ